MCIAQRDFQVAIAIKNTIWSISLEAYESILGPNGSGKEPPWGNKQLTICMKKASIGSDGNS
jgi:hypothetical protein